jgi:hypothetical protein
VKKVLVEILSAVILLALLVSCAAFGFANVELTNQGAVPITELYLGNAEAVEKTGTRRVGPDYWGTNLLETALDQGDSIIFQTLAGMFDIKIVDRKGNEKVLNDVAVSKDQTMAIECAEISACTLK